MDKKKGYTLWEKWTGKAKEEPPERSEDKVFNVLKQYCGDFVAVGLPDEDGRTYAVVEIREKLRRISGEEFRFTDYVLRDKNDFRVLRANPVSGDSQGPEKADLLWLKIYFDGPFNEGIRGSVENKEFYVDEDDDGKDDLTFHELNAGKEGFLTTVRTAKPGKEHPAESQMRYWDFYRKGETGRGEPEGEDIFLFVEFDENDGYITMYEGMKILPTDVELYPAERK